ncbi:MAG: hypothetical protein ACYSUI_03445 [Planctomycetota bacterium]|jgi:hypothetical protein
MNPREKRLAIAVVVLLGIGLVAKVVYPKAIKPMFDVQSEIDDLEAELFDQMEERDKVNDALLEYKEYVARSGGIATGEIHNSLPDQLYAMARGAELQLDRVTPRTLAPEKKTGLQKVSMAMSGEGSLESTIGFLKQCYELPYVARFKDLKLNPIAAKKRTLSNPRSRNRSNGKTEAETTEERVKLNATLEVLVLPNDPIARRHLDLESLEQPAQKIKYAGDSYAMIWERKPFSEYVVDSPVIVKGPVPPEDPPRPEEPPEGPEPPPVDTGDPNARYKTVAMAAKTIGDNCDLGELLVVNTRHKTRQYITTGQQIDGGELIYVHPYGGIVRKENGDYFYEVGSLLSEAIPVAIADDYPAIQAMSKRLRNLVLQHKPAPPAQDALTQGDAIGLPDAPGAKEAVRGGRTSGSGRAKSGTSGRPKSTVRTGSKSGRSRAIPTKPKPRGRAKSAPRSRTATKPRSRRATEGATDDVAKESGEARPGSNDDDDSGGD